MTFPRVSHLIAERESHDYSRSAYDTERGRPLRFRYIIYARRAGGLWGNIRAAVPKRLTELPAPAELGLGRRAESALGPTTQGGPLEHM